MFDDLQKAYAVNDDEAMNGKWMTTRGGIEVRVAKAGNQLFIDEVTRLQKDQIHALRANTKEADRLLTDITNEAMAKTILRDWKVNHGGEPVLYTWELGKDSLSKFPDFREDVSILSDNRENFKLEEIAGK